MAVKYLTDEQWDALIAELHRQQVSTSREAKDAALLLELGAVCGARLEELCRLTVGNLQPCSDGYTIHIARPAKGGRSRILPITRDLGDRLQIAIAERLLTARDRIADLMVMDFCSGVSKVNDASRKQRLRRVFKRMIAKQFSGIDLSTHSLRHTFAMRLLKQCDDIRVVQWALGHKSMNSTIVYLELGDHEAHYGDVLKAMA